VGRVKIAFVSESVVERVRVRGRESVCVCVCACVCVSVRSTSPDYVMKTFVR
jgi:hypothetical protein